MSTKLISLYLRHRKTLLRWVRWRKCSSDHRRSFARRRKTAFRVGWGTSSLRKKHVGLWETRVEKTTWYFEKHVVSPASASWPFLPAPKRKALHFPPRVIRLSDLVTKYKSGQSISHLSASPRGIRRTNASAPCRLRWTNYCPIYEKTRG